MTVNIHRKEGSAPVDPPHLPRPSDREPELPPVAGPEELREMFLGR